MADRLDRLGMSRLIADKIARDPALLEIGLANIARWTAQGRDQPQKLQEWRERILAAQSSRDGLASLLELLREDSEDAAYEREFAPFAGVLSAEERRPFLLACSYTH
jgi:hypothetical protein